MKGRAIFRMMAISCLSLACKSENDEPPQAPGYAVAYTCDLSSLDGRQIPAKVKVFFTWYEPTAKTSPVQRVLVSDERFERSPAAVIVVLDRERRRVEQVRTRDGVPLELSMTTQYISKDESLAHQLVRVANLVLDSSATALVKSKDASGKASADASASGATATTGSTGNRLSSSRVAAFQFEDKSFLATDEDNVQGGYSYGPLASRISRTDVSKDAGAACAYEKSLSTR